MSHKVKKPKKIVVKKTAVKRKSALDREIAKGVAASSKVLGTFTPKEQAGLLMSTIATLHLHDRDAVYRELRKLLKRVIKNK